MIQAPFRVRYETPENTQTVRNVAKLLTISFFFGFKLMDS